MSQAPHEPVMLEEIIGLLRPSPGRMLVDATFGAGGHTRALLQKGAEVIAVDQDSEALEHVRGLESPKLRFVTGNFRELALHLAALRVDRVDGILCDLGVSSMQLDKGERGFAFRQEGPLDMRMGAQDESAADVVNRYPQDELAAIIFRFGEERHSRRVARAIVEARASEAILTTERLVQVVTSAYPPGKRREHPARRTFQALRIFVNDELGALSKLLEQAPDLLNAGGRLAILSYHSLEDRLVKRAMRDDPRYQPLTKRPQTAGDAEIERNPRSRSAKLRAAERSAS